MRRIWWPRILFDFFGLIGILYSTLLNHLFSPIYAKENIPAEEPQKEEAARLPRAHVHQERTEYRQKPPRAGTKETDRLTQASRMHCDVASSLPIVE